MYLSMRSKLVCTITPTLFLRGTLSIIVMGGFHVRVLDFWSLYTYECPQGIKKDLITET